MLITIITLAHAIVYSSSAETMPNTLDLSYTNIEELGPYEISKKGNPDIIILDGNKLKKIHKYAFRQLSSVELRLAYCNLPDNQWQLPILALKDTLLKLDLAGNSIKKLHDLTFKGMKITDLNLSDNNIHVVPSAIGNLRKSLEELYLNENYIQNIEEGTFDGFKIEILQLASNNLVGIPDALYDLRHSLLNVFFQSDTFRIPDYVFTGMKIQELSMVYIGITVLPKALKNIRESLDYLDIRNNSFVCEANTFEGFVISTLILNNNDLESVPPCIKALNATLTHFSIGGNPIQVISENDFSFMQLTYLDLVSTEITYLPLELLSLRFSLDFLNLKNTQLKNASNLVPFITESVNLTYLYLSGPHVKDVMLDISADVYEAFCTQRRQRQTVTIRLIEVSLKDLL